jgi:hypothetical protein
MIILKIIVSVIFFLLVSFISYVIGFSRAEKYHQVFELKETISKLKKELNG